MFIMAKRKREIFSDWIVGEGFKGCKRWAALIKQVYEIDPLSCPKCGGQMKTCRSVGLAKVDHRLHRGKADSRGGKDSPPLWLMEGGIRSRTAAGSDGRLRQWEGDQNRGARSSIGETLRRALNAPLCLQKVGIPVRIHFWKPPRAIHGEGLNGLWNGFP